MDYPYKVQSFIADALVHLIGDRYIVTWAVGHLVTLKEPNELDPKYEKWSFSTLPILPETIPLKVISTTKSQYSKVKKLINDKETDSLICATDAGREGELIFRYIYEMAGCKKPFQRLWISSMTDEAINEGLTMINERSKQILRMYEVLAYLL